MSDPLHPDQLHALDRPDPQGAAIDLMDVLRALNDEAWRQRNVLLSGRADAAPNRDLTRARAIEIAQLADRAMVLAEAASQAQRARGAYAHNYEDG